LKFLVQDLVLDLLFKQFKTVFIKFSGEVQTSECSLLVLSSNHPSDGEY